MGAAHYAHRHVESITEHTGYQNVYQIKEADGVITIYGLIVRLEYRTVARSVRSLFEPRSDSGRM
jgi:hypothetical protein